MMKFDTVAKVNLFANVYKYKYVCQVIFRHSITSSRIYGYLIENHRKLVNSHSINSKFENIVEKEKKILRLLRLP